MRENYSFKKKLREEAHRKKQEEKRNRRLNKSKGTSTPASDSSDLGTESNTVEIPPQV